MTDTNALHAGMVLNQRYTIIRQIARGGMSTVYEGRAKNLGDMRCVIKALDAGRLPQDEVDGAIYQFKREAAILARLNHPNLPRVYDHFSEASGYYLVMEYVSGVSLEDLIEKNDRRPYGISRVLKWVLTICDVLDYLHHQSPPIIFRDLKPSNVMVDKDDQLKLIDFGIARFFVPGKHKDTEAYGTQGYSAPEQYGDIQTDVRSDVYALGVLMHELVTGHDPTTTPFQLPPVRRYNLSLPVGISRVIEKATRTNPDLRYQNVASIRDALVAVQPQSGPKTRVWNMPISSSTNSFPASVAFSAAQRKNRDQNCCWFWAVILLVMIILCGFCVISLWVLINSEQFVTISRQPVWA